ncbi:putative nucleolar protein 5-3 [Arabidopsis thaliana]
MLVLFETSDGFALFKVLDEGKLSNVEDLGTEFYSAESARRMGLHKYLKNNCDDGEILAVADPKLGDIITEKLDIECVHNDAVMELLRGVRSQLTELLSGLDDNDLAPMSLELSHILARYKLKITSDKVETMIFLSIGLLDDLDKERNTYTKRVYEWYGLHFPELANIVQDNILYAKVVKLMGNRINAATLDFSEILADEVEAELKEASMVSTRTEVSDLDLMHIQELCDQVLSIAEDKTLLCDDLKNKMNKIAPNRTALVGELVGARLISHCGSLWNLSKLPGSTIQILGAEKTLYRALKTKQATPKYGLIYHAPLVRQAAPENKSKIARSLAAKSALAIRCNAFARLRNLEGGDLGACEEEEIYEEDTKMEADDEEEPKTEEPSKKRKKEAEPETVEEPAKKGKHEVKDVVKTNKFVHKNVNIKVLSL